MVLPSWFYIPRFIFCMLGTALTSNENMYIEHGADLQDYLMLGALQVDYFVVKFLSASVQNPIS